ncbi:uncharacterized protein LOC127851599 [Dreissena polymorpha]|uniref:Uncharacterized protein n=1 Tax=Dreissena polymorpha TaxID=45954 RepID=A0A9D4CXR8_DREPO|nr:uncharacterized protein LOC127851599 [Dreissena polymorpha]KAH3734564.1 hypothetical protein DPMN_041003 [Dreissena polymorpha]
MTFQKNRKYDPTVAFLLNERQQKLLALRLEELDRLWCNSLRHLSRDRLDATEDLTRLEEEIQNLSYYDKNMDGNRMKEYNDKCILAMKSLKRELSHDNFNFDSSVQIQKKKSSKFSLPKITKGFFVTQIKPRTKKKLKERLQQRRNSNLQQLRKFSISDSNLDKYSKSAKLSQMSWSQELRTKSMSNDDLSVKKHEKHVDVKKLLSERFDTKKESTNLIVLPSLGSRQSTQLSLNVTSLPEGYRYLKHTTNLVLPTVRENSSRQRKLSI